jgi:DNA-binding CsgD family transcriptional regulator
VASISENDAAALLEIVYSGASDNGTEPFPSSVLSSLAELVPSDVFVGYEEADFGGGFRVVEEVDVVGEDGQAKAESLVDVFREYGRQDPLHGSVHAQNERVLRLSDHLTQRQRRSLEFDALVWRPLGIRDALRLWLPAKGTRVRSIYLERGGRNYTARDVTLLSLLRPHLIRMRKHVEFRSRANGRGGLTPREAEVLGWIGHGKQNAEIARLLFISQHTVRKHIENIFEKLDVRTRTAAVAAVPGLTRAEIRENRPAVGSDT